MYVLSSFVNILWGILVCKKDMKLFEERVKIDVHFVIDYIMGSLNSLWKNNSMRSRHWHSDHNNVVKFLYILSKNET